MMVSLRAGLMGFLYKMKKLLIDVLFYSKLFHLLIYSVANATRHSLKICKEFVYVAGLLTNPGLECFRGLHRMKVHVILMRGFSDISG